MKPQKLTFIALSAIMLSCAGNESTTTSADTTDPSLTDSLPAYPVFEEFVSYVQSLPKYVENVDSIFTKYESLKADFSQEEKDSAFFVTLGFMQSIEISEDEVEDMYSEDSQKKLEKQYNKHGLEIWWSEGYPFAMPDLKFVEQKFKKDISAELDDYLDVYKKTLIQTTSDAGLVIEWSELADIILVCEEYLVENPESKYADRVLSGYMENMNFLMWGLDNTPVIDRWSDETAPQLSEGVSEVYQKLIKDTKHKTSKIIADHLAWLESKNFTYEYEEVKYLTETEAKMYLGIE